MIALTDITTAIMEALEKNNGNLSQPGKIDQMISDFLPELIAFLINVVIALILLFIGRKIIKFILKLVERSFERAGMEISLKKFLNSLIRVMLYGVLVIIVADQVGIPTTSFLAVLGSAGLAIGLAIQGSLSNFAGGVLILLLKPFKVGDFVIEGASGNSGTVEAIDLFYTHLLTPDNRAIVVPNGALSNASLTNASAKDIRRLDFTVGISYNADIKKAKELLLGIMKSHENILDTMDIDIFVDSLGDSSVNLGFRGWTSSANYWKEKWSILEEVKEVFDKNGIEIPFNQMDVYLKQ